MQTEADRPSSDQHAVRVEAVPPGEGLLVVFCGPIVGCLTHWTGKASQACPGEAKCPSAVHRVRTVWKGYAPGRWWAKNRQRWIPAVIEVTECLEELLHGRDLAGEVWLLQREDAKKKSGQVSGCFVERKQAKELLRTFDVRPTLLRFYHPIEPLLGVKNPLPPKVVMPSIEGDAPAIPEAAAPAPPPPMTPEQIENLRKHVPRFASRVAATNGKG